jgi:hypothetical protein
LYDDALIFFSRDLGGFSDQPGILNEVACPPWWTLVPSGSRPGDSFRLQESYKNPGNLASDKNIPKGVETDVLVLSTFNIYLQL